MDITFQQANFYYNLIIFKPHLDKKMQIWISITWIHNQIKNNLPLYLL